MLVTQFLDALTDSTRAALLGNVGTMVAFRSNPEDAKILARSFDRAHQAFNPYALQVLEDGHAMVAAPSSEPALVSSRRRPKSGQQMRSSDKAASTMGARGRKWRRRSTARWAIPFPEFRCRPRCRASICQLTSIWWGTLRQQAIYDFSYASIHRKLTTYEAADLPATAFEQTVNKIVVAPIPDAPAISVSSRSPICIVSAPGTLRAE